MVERVNQASKILTAVLSNPHLTHDPPLARLCHGGKPVTAKGALALCEPRGDNRFQTINQNDADQLPRAYQESITRKLIPCAPDAKGSTRVSGSDATKTSGNDRHMRSSDR